MLDAVTELSMALTPAAIAALVSPTSRAWCARWLDTSDDEHAVSVLTQGPYRLGQLSGLSNMAQLVFTLP